MPKNERAKKIIMKSVYEFGHRHHMLQVLEKIGILKLLRYPSLISFLGREKEVNGYSFTFTLGENKAIKSIFA